MIPSAELRFPKLNVKISVRYVVNISLLPFPISVAFATDSVYSPRVRDLRWVYGGLQLSSCTIFKVNATF